MSTLSELAAANALPADMMGNPTSSAGQASGAPEVMEWSTAPSLANAAPGNDSPVHLPGQAQAQLREYEASQIQQLVNTLRAANMNLEQVTEHMLATSMRTMADIEILGQ